ncbi:MAG: hypothetical protein V7647_3533, partial [Acidobacteriota bacterium]
VLGYVQPDARIHKNNEHGVLP